MDRTFTPPDLAKRWRLSLPSVLRIIRSGKLAAFDVGTPGRHAYRVTFDSVLAYEQSLAVPAQQPALARRKKDVMAGIPRRYS